MMRALASRRFFDERTGEPMPAYVVGEFVIEKARRDWDARPYRGSAGNPSKREWWEVRRQLSNGHPGVSVGRDPLFTADTYREARAFAISGLTPAEHARQETDRCRVATGVRQRGTAVPPDSSASAGVSRAVFGSTTQP